MWPFFAILFTGRYQRSIFDFNVGSCAGPGESASTPMTPLEPIAIRRSRSGARPTTPRLSMSSIRNSCRGLVLVKWWLLAIPHYLVLAALLGGGWFAWNAGWDEDARGWGGGPAASSGLLVLFAAIALLFTTRYPRGIFDLLVGLTRWVFRVVAYAALMTDAYPPFRLDQGGSELGRSAPEGGGPEVT